MTSTSVHNERKHRRINIEDVTALASIRQISFLKAFPKVSAQWHPKKNCGWSPADFNSGSGVYAWWLCPVDKRHSWQAPIFKRAKQGHGCPFCCGQQFHVTNSLAKKFPKIAKEMHPTKNGTLDASEIIASSKQRVWWKCKCGYEWQTHVETRTKGGTGCRKCNQNMLDLTDYPIALKHFDKARNKGVNPAQITSLLILHWRCEKGEDHLWQQVFRKQLPPKCFCPFCDNRKVSKTNCLAKTFPAIAREFHKTKNRPLTPMTMIGTSNKIVYWACKTCKKSWSAPIRRRTVHGAGCPKCWIKNRPIVLKKAARKRKLAVNRTKK